MCSCQCSCSKSGIWNGEIRCVNFDLTENLENEVIKSISMYKTPIFNWNSPSWCFYHSLIVVETNCYWSVEKNNVEIIMQKSSDLNNVLNKINGRRREPEFSNKEDVEFVTIKELVDWINGNEINNSYCSSIWHKNCQGFANKAYNFIKETYEQKMKYFLSKYGIGETKKPDANLENPEIDDVTETHEFLEFNEIKSEINLSVKIYHFLEYKTTLAEYNSYVTEGFMIFFTNDGIYSFEMCEGRIFFKKLNSVTDRVKPNDQLIKDGALENITLNEVKKFIEKCKKQYSDVPKINQFQFLLKSLFGCFTKGNKEKKEK